MIIITAGEYQVKKNNKYDASTHKYTHTRTPIDMHELQSIKKKRLSYATHRKCGIKVYREILLEITRKVLIKSRHSKQAVARKNVGTKRVQRQVALKLSGAAHVASSDAAIACGSSAAVKFTKILRGVTRFTCFSPIYFTKVHFFMPNRYKKCR